MIEISRLSAQVGSFRLADMSFRVEQGGYGVVIGPAGSGKTTLLETIAGIVPLQGGRVLLGSKDVTALPPEERGLGFVYQRGFLFPHLSVQENVEYGAASPAAAREAAERTGVDALLHRRVQGLSGGERQLVALARALARKPSVLLLDEPYGALDPRRRASVRREVRALHREWGTTVLQVTHDFTEAGLLGDVAVILDAGRVLQWGSPETVFRRPASAYIAEFLGAENVLAGEARWLPEDVARDEDGEDALLAAGHRPIEFRSGDLVIYAVGDAMPGACYAVIRADEILISRAAPESSARNVFEGTITEISRVGALARVTVDVRGTPIVAALTTRSVRELDLRVGGRVWAAFKALAVHLC